MSNGTDIWFPGALRAGNAELRVFCFPHVGGGAAQFAKWRKAAPPHWLICPARLPGRESRFNEQPFTDMDALVSCLAEKIEPLLDRPFVCFGHSLGGLVAYELTRQLMRNGQRLPERLFVSGVAAPDRPRQDEPISGLPDSLLLEELEKRYGSVGISANGDPEIVSILVRALRADMALVESYRFVPGDPVRCPITAYGGNGDPRVSAAGLARWEFATTAAWRLRLFTGGHFYLNECHASVIEDMACQQGIAAGSNK